MKVMVLVKASKDSEAGKMPSEALIRAMSAFNEQLVKAGVLLAADGLHPSSKGKRVRCEGKQRTVIDGPFAETKELVSGFWIWQVKSMDEAIEWIRRSPFEEGEIELRPVFSAEEFDALVPADVAAKEQALRAQTEGKKK